MSIEISQKENGGNWPEDPSPEIIGELASNYEAQALASSKDPELKTRTLGLTLFLLGQEIPSESFDKYLDLIKKEIKIRYPEGQIELEF